MDFDTRKNLASSWFKSLQDSFCEDITKLENKRVQFKSTSWKKNITKDEGGGEYRILQDGKIFEKV